MRDDTSLANGDPRARGVLKQRSAGGVVSGSWGAPLFLPLMAVLLCFSFPAALKQAARVQLHHQLSPKQQLADRTAGYASLIRGVEWRIPPDEPIIIQAPERSNPLSLYWDRIINYWLYPRKIYSFKALRLAGEDIQQFIEARGIRWRYRSGKLVNLGKPAPPPERRQLPCSLHSGSTARVAIGIFLALAHFLLVGACIIEGLGCGRLLVSRIERVALWYLVGTGATGAWALLCFTTGIGVRLSTVLSSIPLALTFFVSRKPRAGRRLAPSSDLRSGGSERGEPTGRASKTPAAKPSHRMDRIAAFVAFLMLGALVLRALAMPMGGYDDRYLWAHKAHIMLHESSIWESGFQDPQSLQAHPEYPLLIPGVEAVVFLYTGGFNDQYVTLLFPLFFGALLVVLYAGLEALGRRRGRGLAVLALVMVPVYWGYGMERDGAAAFSAYPDLPLSAFAATAMIYFLRAREHGSTQLYLISALLILFCGLTKSEGKVHFLVFVVLALTPLAVGIGPRGQLRSPLAAFAGAGLLLALYELAVVHPTQPGILPDDYSKFIGWEQISANLERLPSIIQMLSKEYFLSVRFGFSGLVLVAAALFFLRVRSGSHALGPLCYVGALLVLYCGPYLVLPETVWREIHYWSSGRLVLQLLPMTFLAVSLLVLPRCHSPAAT